MNASEINGWLDDNWKPFAFGLVFSFVVGCFAGCMVGNQQGRQYQWERERLLWVDKQMNQGGK